jgi:hypothetical protein
MIENATILRLDTPQPAGPAGDVTYTLGSAIAIRGCLDQPSNAQRFSLGVVGQDVTAVLYVSLDAALAIEPRMRITVQGDGDAAAICEVLHRTRWIKDGGLSHDEVFLKGL